MVANLLPNPIRVKVEPVGKWFEKYCLLSRGHSEQDEDDSDDDHEEEEDVYEDCPDLPDMDPKDWKNQDHYYVLGLKMLRYKASHRQIKTSHKAAVLKHHPDKRRATGADIPADCDADYFTCITRAYEILGDKIKRRAYDSVDPTFDDEVPANNKSNKQNFFEVFGPVFESNARWSNKKSVPSLLDINAPIEAVDKFYTFWYNFDSWREFSYLDEEDKAKAEDAFERRWMEKQNRAARQKRKKEEMIRIRQLVDNAYACDPRIKRFVEMEKKKRDEEKASRIAAARKIVEEKEAYEREKREKEQLEKERLEEEKRREQQAAKKEKEKEKKALKKERQKFHQYCKTKQYFKESDADRCKMMDQISHLTLSMSLSSITSLNEAIQTTTDDTTVENLINEKLTELHKKLDAETQQHLVAASKKKVQNQNLAAGEAWSYEEVQLLIKSVNLFSAGTQKRWEVVSGYINTHSNTSKKRTPKECLARAKNLKGDELKAEANQKVFQRFQENQKSSSSEIRDEVEISQNYDAPTPWTSEEQRLLEQSLKTYPNGTPKRWDKIAETVSGRTKKECMMRYKDLVEMVKAKKTINKQAAKK